MGRFLRFPFPIHSDDPKEYSDQPQSNSGSDSSSHSSLSSQPSLPSVPSLTPSLEHGGADHHCVATLKGHSSYIFSLALAGKHLYCGSSNGEIRVWDRNYPSVSDNHVVADDRSAVKSIVVSGDKLFTAHNDHKIRVWRIDNSTEDRQRYKMISVLPTMGDRFLRLLSAKNYVEIRRNKKRTWVHHVDTVSALALTEDNQFLYSVSWDRSMKIWRTSDFKCLESVQNAHDDAINAVVLSGDGVAYTGSADRKIKVWRKEEGGVGKHALVATLEKHKSAVNALALSGDGAVLYSGACDRSIVVWEGGGGDMAVVGALRGHRKAILCLAVVGDLVGSGSADRTVRVWRRGGGRSYSCLAVLEGHGCPVKCLTAAAAAADGSDGSYLIYSGSLDFEIKVWKVRVPSSKIMFS